MRNTHFGDGGFGFGVRTKGGDLSIDSERNLSRKRGAKIGIPNLQQDEFKLRESL